MRRFGPFGEWGSWRLNKNHGVQWLASISFCFLNRIFVAGVEDPSLITKITEIVIEDPWIPVSLGLSSWAGHYMALPSSLVRSSWPHCIRGQHGQEALWPTSQQAAEGPRGCWRAAWLFETWGWVKTSQNQHHILCWWDEHPQIDKSKLFGLWPVAIVLATLFLVTHHLNKCCTRPVKLNLQEIMMQLLGDGLSLSKWVMTMVVGYPMLASSAGDIWCYDHHLGRFFCCWRPDFSWLAPNMLPMFGEDPRFCWVNHVALQWNNVATEHGP